VATAATSGRWSVPWPVIRFVPVRAAFNGCRHGADSIRGSLNSTAVGEPWGLVAPPRLIFPLNVVIKTPFPAKWGGVFP
jgi:hypothetical protein